MNVRDNNGTRKELSLNKTQDLGNENNRGKNIGQKGGHGCKDAGKTN